jgi:hypothetical protein
MFLSFFVDKSQLIFILEIFECMNSIFLCGLFNCFSNCYQILQQMSQIYAMFYIIHNLIYNMHTQKPPHDYSQKLYKKYKESFE